MVVGDKQRLVKICKLLKSQPIRLWEPIPARYRYTDNARLTTKVGSLQFELTLKKGLDYDYNMMLGITDLSRGSEFEFYLEDQHKLMFKQIWEYRLTIGEPNSINRALGVYRDVEIRLRREPTQGLLYPLFTQTREKLYLHETEMARQANAPIIACGRKKLETLLCGK